MTSVICSVVALAILPIGQRLGPSAPAASLNFANGAFVFRQPGKKICTEALVPTNQDEVKQAIFRKDAKFAVWDGRGLSIRARNRTKSYRLADIALTPKLFSREAILQTRALIADGSRQKDASALSGSARIGSLAFFLVRWDDRQGNPWLEALVTVDLALDQPVPELVGRFEGLSPSRDRIGSWLVARGQGLQVVTRTADAWVLAKYDSEQRVFDSYVLGLKLIQYVRVSRDLGIFVEEVRPEEFVVGRVDLASCSRRNLMETRKTVEVLDGALPSIVRLGGGLLHNLDAGAQTPIPAGATVRRTAAGVLVWWPADAPKRAVMLNPERWQVLAKWDRDAPKKVGSTP